MHSSDKVLAMAAVKEGEGPMYKSITDGMDLTCAFSDSATRITIIYVIDDDMRAELTRHRHPCDPPCLNLCLVLLIIKLAFIMI